MSRHSEETPELQAALAAARAALVPPAMPAASLRVRVKTSPALRRLLPTRLVVRRAVGRGRARWESPSEREAALRMIEAIVGGTPRAHEAVELARRALIEDEVHKALFWQPWKTASMDATSNENVKKALSAERGVLLSSCHMGPIFLHMSALSSRGHTIYITAAPWFFQTPSNDFWGRRIAHWWRGLRRRGERLVVTVGSFPVLCSLLRQGELVLIYFDMPGSRSTQFLGKQVMLATGTARLAVETDALVLPMRSRRHRDRVWADVAPPLDPREFSGAQELHDAVAAVHERWILELPATLEDPNRAGAWEGGASASGWVRPPSVRLR
jgi:lauroyl/myristoyl acyltransferase